MLEQYVYRMPVTRSAAIQMRAYRRAYEATGRPLHLAKAEALAAALVEVQGLHGGSYPTYFTRNTLDFWINNVVYPAREMIALGRMGRP